jgi:hypothetical protein
MGKIWVGLLESGKAAVWGVPPGVVAELAAAVGAADSALRAAQGQDRSMVVTARCSAAFAVMVGRMRDLKRRSFLMPPLTAADFAALGLRPRDTILTRKGNPTAELTVETFLVGRRQLGIRIIFLSGKSDDPANRGFRVWYTVTALGEPVPTAPEELHRSFYTQRKKDLIEFPFDESGRVAHFAVQIENGRKTGPWGPIVSALIP